MVKVFFGCSMRGGFAQVSQDELRRMVDTIESLGYTLMSRHQTSATFTADEAPLSPQQIHDRDYHWLLGAEIGIFEISNPSLGAGGEISDLTHLGKPVLCLFKKGLERAVSAYIVGKAGSQYVKSPFQCAAYGSLPEAKAIIKKFVEAQQQKKNGKAPE